ncbi:hypothetical protein VF04_04435 [Nostoc linckia z7]|uniref:Uncharacterized protein n=2 Tax=Nostoc linckia TaxID=92942 RepID=A0A9Q5ZFX6_NOSLI|nr:hypothetical protein [Nostoc linckia]PHK42959.1 hypothetical protein VF12_01135 [Nostoc linckia z15]PHK48116.1 hypothetical protein VF13_02110 [Nostoc linckia z16]PHJ65036.1 hypothetical protein VF02_11920 [Nostoc linckia z1]PHJ70077.1 hypothetical protein VF05_11315 [Nostoc linckia z3]PHJ75115.1 hypothetical protein VF03_12240 [Nostoc linckia z2]
MNELHERLQESRIKALTPVIADVLCSCDLNGYRIDEVLIVLSNYVKERKLSAAVRLLEEAVNVVQIQQQKNHNLLQLAEIQEQLQENRIEALTPVFVDVLCIVEANGYTIDEVVIVLTKYARKRDLSAAVRLLEDAATAIQQQYQQSNVAVLPALSYREI